MVGRLSRRAVITSLPMVSLAGCLTALSDRLTGRREIKEELVSTYDRGLQTYNRGTEELGEVMSYEDLSAALTNAETGVESFETALLEFQRAESIARELDNAEAIEICQNAVEKTRILLDAAREALRAAEASDEEDYEAVGDHLDRFTELRSRAREVRIESTRTLADTVGL